MKIVIKIEKRNAMIILAACLFLITIIAVSGTYTNPLTHVGHDLNELGPGELAIDLVIDGDLIVDNIQMENLIGGPSTNDLTSILCEAEGDYCMQLVYDDHGTSDCFHAGGELVQDPADDPDDYFCKIPGACPSNWNQYKGWSETSRKSCSGTSGCAVGSGDCRTGSHEWSDRPGRETCTYYKWETHGLTSGCKKKTCKANWVYMGCY
jgi:hypothetical protein